MKRLVIIVLLLAVSITTRAQIVGSTNNQEVPRTITTDMNNSNAIGIRLAMANSFGIELSAQWGINRNRLETDIEMNFSGENGFLNLDGIYQWVWRLSGGFGWYTGVGATVGRYWVGSGASSMSGVGIGVLAQIGLEYSPLVIPIQFTFDIRPVYYFVDYSGFGYNFGLGIRYRF